MKVLIYARCSTDESKQDVSNQIDVCKKFCEGQGWKEYEVFQEYESAYGGKSRKVFNDALERIRLKQFDILMVYMLDRFSRDVPTKTVADLHKIVEVYGCRFISIKEGIDSSQDMWQIVMMIFAYMANSFSKMLGIRVREGINRKKKEGTYTGGRPPKRDRVDIAEVKRLYSETQSFRKTAATYNQTRYARNRISRNYVKRILAEQI